ncbi:MAG TPA: DUF4129 domain-containing protein [Phenylobacterium sp.]|nr:DUF4129 domain-containing protein [Phenylobacterium sp.]
MTGVSTAADVAERKLVAAHQVLLHTRGIQFDFAAAPTLPKPPHWLMALLRGLEPLAPVLKYVFWGGVIAGGLFILWIAVRDLIPLGWRRGKPVVAATDWRPAPDAARALLEEADQLARAGRFGEAIHLLLFRSIEDITAKASGPVPRAFTSRDIVAVTPMPDQARGAFARIAEAVEHSFFGGRAADEADFRRCRNDYETFAFPDSWR